MGTGPHVVVEEIKIFNAAQRLVLRELDENRVRVVQLQRELVPDVGHAARGTTHGRTRAMDSQTLGRATHCFLVNPRSIVCASSARRLIRTPERKRERRETETERERETETHTERERGRERERQTHTHTHTDTQRDTHR